MEDQNSADNPTNTYEVDAPIAPPDNDDSKVLVAGTPALTPGISGSYSRSPMTGGMKQSPSARLFPLHTVRQGEHLV